MEHGIPITKIRWSWDSLILIMGSFANSTKDGVFRLGQSSKYSAYSIFHTREWQRIISCIYYYNLWDLLRQNNCGALFGAPEEGLAAWTYSWFQLSLAFLSNWKKTLQWRHNGRDGVSNHQPRDCLLNRLFRRRSKNTSKLRVTGLCAGNSPVTGEFPA